MQKATGLRRIFNLVGFSKKNRPSCWSVIEVEHILKELAIDSYEFNYQSRVVRLGDHSHINKIMHYIAPRNYNVIPSEFNGLRKLRVGCWQFEG
ncbi:MAG: hypothetical protein QME63_02585 [Actinomycetota bacterium]|nr:hypothetical protein [Actinomycetota bacterium]